MLRFRNEDEFLAHFCKKGEKVTMIASDLQSYMIQKNNLERELRKKDKLIEDMKYRLELKDAKIASLELDNLATYTLDLSA